MKLTDMLTPHEKAQLLRLVEKMPTTTPCMSCQNYRAGWCGLDESARKIPAEVAAEGVIAGPSLLIGRRFRAERFPPRSHQYQPTP